MPHIIVKLYPGKSDLQKKQLTKEIVKNIVGIVECDETAVSVAFEEIEPADWVQKVYKSDIMNGQGILYKKPGYDPFLVQQEPDQKTSGLKEQIQEAASIAEKECANDDFNAMSWLDVELEDNPESFDRFFDIAWNKLNESEKEKRTIAIRCVL